MESNLSIFTLAAYAFGIISKKSLDAFPLCVTVLGLTFRSLIHFEFFFFIWYKVSIQHHPFACGYPVFPTQFVENTVFSPLNGLGILVKNHLTIYARVYFWAFYSIPLVQYHPVLITVAL